MKMVIFYIYMCGFMSSNNVSESRSFKEVLDDLLAKAHRAKSSHAFRESLRVSHSVQL